MFLQVEIKAAKVFKMNASLFFVVPVTWVKHSFNNGKTLLIIFFVVSSLNGPVTGKVDWTKYLPKTCVDDLNYTFPEKPIELNVSLWVHAIYDISEEKLEFGMQIELFEFWNDPSLETSNFDRHVDQSAPDIPKPVIDCIWKPDTVFSNAKETTLYIDTIPNMVYKLSLPRGIFLRRSRYKVTASCSMNFEYYPMDVQSCFLEITLYKSRKGNVMMRWFKEQNRPVLKSKPLHYLVKESHRTSSEISYKGYTTISQYLQAHFLFERNLSASLFNTYIPSFLVVCVSMVSFWLDIDAVPGRVTLGVTAILTLSTQIVQARSGLPVLHYMTAMDVWLLGCLMMVFLSLVEFVLANSFSRRKRSVSPKPNTSETVKEMAMAWAETLASSTMCASCKSMVKPFERPDIKKLNSKKLEQSDSSKDNYLDRLSRVMFPVFMIIYSSVYWCYYYHGSVNQH